MTDVVKTVNVLVDVKRERAKQDEKWGVQSHPDGTGGPVAEREAEEAKATCAFRAKLGKLSWFDILAEEVAEARAERDYRKLRAELVQCAAVCVAWIEDLDARSA